MKKYLKMFIPFFLIYLILGLIYSYNFNTTGIYDLFFTADTPRILGDMTLVEYNHYRVMVHPLFVLLIQTPTQIINFIISDSILCALLIQSCFSAISVCILNYILGKLKIERKTKIFFTLIFALSFTQILFNMTIETYMFATTFLLLMFAYVLNKIDKELSNLDLIILVILGILSLGITIINYVQFIIASFVLIMWHKKNKNKSSYLNSFYLFILINACVVGLSCFLSEIQNVVYNNAPLFFRDNLNNVIAGSSEETLYVSKLSFSSIVNQLKTVFGTSFFCNAVVFTENTSKKVINFGEISIFVILILSIITTFSLYITSKFIKENYKNLKQHKFIIIVFLAFIFNFLLHLVYGNDVAFLYTGHYLFLTIILFAYISNNQKWCDKKWFRICLLGFLIIQILYNASALINIFNYLNNSFAPVDNISKIILLIIFISVLTFIFLLKLKVKIKLVLVILLTPLIYSSYIYFNNKMNMEEIVTYEYQGEEVKELAKYTSELSNLKDELGIQVMFEDSPSFYFFGMGNRPKLLYQHGILYDIATNKIIKKYDIKEEIIIPNQYKVVLKDKDNNKIVIKEDESGIYICDSKCQILDGSESSVNLPEFSEYKYGEVLKVLHQEILFNIYNYRMRPNIITYDGVWFRDTMMGVMSLSKTNNVSLIESWIDSVNVIYDMQNGVAEPDNLGELLYIFSQSSNDHQDMIDLIFKKAGYLANGKRYISGSVDFTNMSYYPTATLIYGFNTLGIDHHYELPAKEGYYYLTWWLNDNVSNEYIKSPQFPYLEWANCHSGGESTLHIATNLYPLSYEQNASQAHVSYLPKYLNYYQKENTSPTHLWHASEMFLYLLERK